MFGEEMTEMNDEIKDAVGEISNMIAGQVTTKLAELGKTMNIKLLNVEMGEGHHVAHLEKKPVVVMPFSMEKGDFVIEVCFE
jgi:chemotaxis protein CheX